MAIAHSQPGALSLPAAASPTTANTASPTTTNAAATISGRFTTWPVRR